jgi:hypothetical protein
LDIEAVASKQVLYVIENRSVERRLVWFHGGLIMMTLLEYASQECRLPQIRACDPKYPVSRT